MYLLTKVNTLTYIIYVLCISCRYLIDAGEMCFNQSAEQLKEILLKIRLNYCKLFNAKSVDWGRYSTDGTKLKFYKEVNYNIRSYIRTKDH